MRKNQIPILLIIIAVIGYIIFLIYDNQNISVSGTTNVENTKNIMIDFPVFVKQIYVKKGQQVKRGDLLIFLDLSDYKVALSGKVQELKDTKKMLQEEIANISKLENDLSNAEKNLNFSLKQLRDKENLYKQGLISEYELENTKSLVRSYNNTASNIKIPLQAKKNGVSSIEVFTGKITNLELEIKTLKNKLELSFFQEDKIVSPITGVIYEVGYNSGDIIDPSENKKILSILDLSSLYVDANVPEDLIKDIKIGAIASFTPIANPYKNFEGKVEEISKVGDKNKDGDSFFSVKIKIDNKDNFLVPFLNGKVRIKK